MAVGGGIGCPTMMTVYEIMIGHSETFHSAEETQIHANIPSPKRRRYRYENNFSPLQAARLVF